MFKNKSCPFQSTYLAAGKKLSQFVYVDIGASGGIPNLFDVPVDQFKAVGFEPDKRTFEKLVSESPRHWKIYNTALGDCERKTNLFLTRKPANSSIFEPNTKHLKKFPNASRFDLIEKVEVELKTCDQTIDFQHWQIDFIKIDTQGSELEILKGTKKGLLGGYGALIEVEFVHHYKGQALFSEVDQLLRESNFILFDLRRVYWKKECGKKWGGVKGQLVHGDALYLKDNQEFVKGLIDLDLSDEEIKSKVIKALDICEFYKYYDHGLDLLQSIFEIRPRIFSEEESKYLYSVLKKKSYSSWKYHGFLALQHFFKFVRQLYKSNEISPIFGDKKVGN